MILFENRKAMNFSKRNKHDFTPPLFGATQNTVYQIYENLFVDVGMSGGWASNLQRTHYYNHESSPGPGPDQVDYHLAQRTRTPGLPHSRTTSQPPILYTDSRYV